MTKPRIYCFLYRGGVSGKEHTYQCRQMPEASIWYLGQEDSLEEDMTTHSSIHDWRISFKLCSHSWDLQHTQTMHNRLIITGCIGEILARWILPSNFIFVFTKTVVIFLFYIFFIWPLEGKVSIIMFPFDRWKNWDHAAKSLQSCLTP